MEIPSTKINYTGKIREVVIGTGNKSIKVGGQNCFNFHQFEGTIPNYPIISYEVWDTPPEEWPETCKKPYQDVLGDPLSWAKKCINEYGANVITIQLSSIDPTGLNKSAVECGKTIEKIVKEIDVPLIFWGCGNVEKDTETLKIIAEICDGKNVALGPCVDKNYKQIGASAITYKHVVIASTPIDVNLGKQLNILLLELGVPENKIIMDPTTGGLGYGIEYTYSVMERDRIAGLIQQDSQLAFPMICNLAKEVWKTKEVFLPFKEFPKMGKEEERGIMMEAITAVLLTLSGADILIMRHPKAIKLMDELIKEME